MLRTFQRTVIQPSPIKKLKESAEGSSLFSPESVLNPKGSKGLSSDNLFQYFIGLVFIACLIVLTLQLFTGDFKILLPTALSCLVVVLVYIFHFKGWKTLSYHFFMIAMNVLNGYMVIIDGQNFQAIYSIYVVGLVFTFIYFRKIQILLVYLILSLVSQLIILYYNADADKFGISTSILADGVCIVAVNLAAFLMCYFYLINLEKAKNNLELAAKDLDKQKEELKGRSIELAKYIESNIQLENYTHLAAHELKAPLRSVKEFADILKDKANHKLDDKEKEMFSFISDKTDKMDTLLNDLTSLGKVSQADLVREHINLDALFKDILIDRRDLIRSSSAQVDFELEVGTMVGQFGLIKQLFSNLIGNALKFIEASIIPKVLVTADMVGDEIVFKVIDNGIGIKQEYRNRVFQIFERLHSESDYKGSGIGLSICKKIVDLHKGTIAVEDSELGGTCFVVRIPKLEL